MKATYKDVTMEGTPKEIGEMIRLIDVIEFDRKPKYTYPVPPYQPWWQRPYTTSSTNDFVLWNGGTVTVNSTK